MPVKVPRSEKRTIEQLREHYVIEKELASRLRNAGKEERRYLYTALYDELYRRVPLHPQLTQKSDPGSQFEAVSTQMGLLGRYLNPETTFLEVGAGDCSLSREVSKRVRKVYAVDVSEEITKGKTFPENLELIISDGSSIPVTRGSVTLAYSSNLMEHLHPDDAVDQLKSVYAALATGGKYICITPNRLLGPYDISRYFDDLATGFHLKEYTFTELGGLFQKAGFSGIGACAGARRTYVKIPPSLILLCERVLGRLPFSPRRAIASTLPFRALLGIRIVGTK
jgi:SAM-dependent methyltransferase